MSSHRTDQAPVRDYLLGLLSDEAREQFEQLLLTQDEFFAQVLAVEDELVDEYLRGSLESDEAEMFAKHFLNSAERQQKLRFAKAFKKYAAAHAAEEFQPEPHKGFSRSTWWPFFTASPWRAVAVVAVLLLAAAGVWRVFFYRSDVDKGLVALNNAYKEQRPLESRITKLNYAPFVVTRGGESPRVDSRERDFAERYLLDAVHDHPGANSYHALGKFYLAEKNFDKAIAQFEEALRADPNNAQIHADLGAALLERGKVEAEKSVATTAPSETSKEGQANSGKALTDLARSLDRLNKALELDPNLLEARFNRALCYQYMMLPRQAAEEWREYLKKDSTSKWADEARVNLKLLEQQASQPAYTKEGLLSNFLQARTNGNHDEAWRIASMSRDDLAGTNIGLQLLGKYLDSRDKLDQAKEYLDSLSYLGALESQRVGERYTLDTANNCLNLTTGQVDAYSRALQRMSSGYSFYKTDQLFEAMEAFRTAGEDFSQAGDHAQKTLAEYWVAYCSVETGNLAYGLSAFPRLIEFCRARNYHWLLMRMLYSMSIVEFNMNETSKAIEYGNDSLKIGNELGDVVGVFNALDTLTDFYRLISNYSAAIQAISDSQPLLNRCVLNPIKVWRHHVVVASTFNSAHYYGAAVVNQREATSRALAAGDLSMISLSYAHLGLMLGKQGDYEGGLNNAWQAFNTAAAQPTNAESPKMMAYSALQVAHLYHEKGECDRAIENYEKTIALLQNIDFPTGVYQSHKGLFMCSLSLGDDARAQQELETTLSSLEKYRATIVEGDNRNKFFDNEQSVYDLAIDFATSRLKNREQAFDYSEASRARSLFDLINSSPKVPGKNQDLTPPKVLSPLSFSKINEQLPGQTQIVQYAILRDKLVIWVINNQGLTLTEKRISEESLNQKIASFVNAVTATNETNAVTRQAKELFSDLIEPVQQLLDSHKQLCIVADKSLNTLPFGALISPTSGNYLIEDYCISYAPSSSVFIAATNHANSLTLNHGEKLLSVGNPSFDRNSFPQLSDLPEAASEAKAISAYYSKAEVLIGPNARKDAVVGGMANAQVIHLAAHAIDKSGDELHAGLVLAKNGGKSPNDECLQADQLYRMKLPNARLLILSACRSGVGDYYQGEGTLSLARTFLAADVPMVVASLWPVDSKATEELMIKFHRSRKYMSSAAALREAQLFLIKNDNQQLRQPYSWAAFFLTGGYANF